MIAKKIHIKLNDETKKKLSKFCKTHHVSYSTVAYYLAFCYSITPLYESISQDYLVRGTDTTIKPRPVGTENYTSEEKMHIYSNIIYLYFAKKTKEYVDTELDQHIRDKFNKFIQEEEDIFANYNEYVRNTRRALRNKATRQYLKDAIAKEESKNATTHSKN